MYACVSVTIIIMYMRMYACNSATIVMSLIPSGVLPLGVHRLKRHTRQCKCKNTSKHPLHKGNNHIHAVAVAVFIHQLHTRDLNQTHNDYTNPNLGYMFSTWDASTWGINCKCDPVTATSYHRGPPWEAPPELNINKNVYWKFHMYPLGNN